MHTAVGKRACWSGLPPCFAPPSPCASLALTERHRQGARGEVADGLSQGIQLAAGPPRRHHLDGDQEEEERQGLTDHVGEHVPHDGHVGRKPALQVEHHALCLDGRRAGVRRRGRRGGGRLVLSAGRVGATCRRASRRRMPGPLTLKAPQAARGCPRARNDAGVTVRSASAVSRPR